MYIYIYDMYIFACTYTCIHVIHIDMYIMYTYYGQPTYIMGRTCIMVPPYRGSLPAYAPLTSSVSVLGVIGVSINDMIYDDY